LFPYFSEIFFDGQTRKKFVNRSVNSFSIFKKGIKPEWEDDANKGGGEWFCRKRMDPTQLDEYWLNLVLGMIGETIDKGNEITGARIVDKSKQQIIYRMELWFRRKDMTIANELKDKMQECLADTGGGATRSVPQFNFRDHS
jgi:hypothetical protein